MKKSILIIAALAMGASSSFAQLSTRENCATNECIGARPVKGDMALTFAINIAGDDTASLPLENNLTSGSVLTFKYFTSDDVAFRIGFRLAKTSYNFKGDLDSASQAAANQGGNIEISEREFKSSDRLYLLVPGIEKHFSPSNIFDVYAGADLHLGFSRSVDIDNTSFRANPVSGDDHNNSTSKTTQTVVGLGGVVGFNVFIAHLPISLGLEYGWNARWRLGGKTHVETDVTSGGVNTSNDYYTQRDDINGYTKLKRKEFAMDTNQNVRLVLNIFFSGKRAQ
ncbi:MAG: hypothetical protein ABI772_04030 [Bacteroidota bacterium]